MNQLPIKRLLSTDDDVARLLGEKIFEDVAIEGTKTPYLVWSEVSGTPNTSIDNLTKEDEIQYQILIYSPYQKTASDIRTAVCKALQHHSSIDSRIGHYEKATRLYARGFTGSWWLNR